MCWASQTTLRHRDAALQGLQHQRMLWWWGSHSCTYTVSGSFSLPSPGFFSPFPHGTGSLSVSQEYLALEDGPPYSDRIPRVPPYSSSSQHMRFCVRGCHPVSRAFPDASTNTHADSGSGLLPVRSPLLGESRLISLLGVLRCFSSPGSPRQPMDSVNDSVTNHTGFPIRKSPVITVHITLPALIAD